MKVRGDKRRLECIEGSMFMRTINHHRKWNWVDISELFLFSGFYEGGERSKASACTDDHTQQRAKNRNHTTDTHVFKAIVVRTCSKSKIFGSWFREQIRKVIVVVDPDGLELVCCAILSV